MTNPTDRQVAFLRTLLQERQPEHLEMLDRKIAEGALTRRDVSAKIDYLKRLPAPARPATERQVEYVTDLLTKRIHELDADAELTDLTYDHARALIDMLKAARRRKVAAEHGVPAGRYAVMIDDVHHFRRVDTRGRVWIIAGPNEHPCQANDTAFAAIMPTYREAAALYGQEIGHCGRCGLRLTDETSRSIGLGPVCRDKAW